MDRNGWIPAGELRIGEHLLAADGSTPAVESFTPRPEPEPVYNIEVDGDHCYRVGEQGLLVHNASVSADMKTGEQALTGAFNKAGNPGCCVQETVKASLDGLHWRQNFKFMMAGLGVIYLLRRRSDGKAMKVGKTESTAKTWQGRWEKYTFANDNCGAFDILAWAFDKSCVPTLNTAETAVRGAFCGECPWDNTEEAGGYRLGRGGPGVPGEPVSDDSLGYWMGCNWVKGPNPNPKQSSSKKPDAATLKQLLQANNWNNTAVAGILGVTEASIRNWRNEYGI